MEQKTFIQKMELLHQVPQLILLQMHTMDILYLVVILQNVLVLSIYLRIIWVLSLVGKISFWQGAVALCLSKVNVMKNTFFLILFLFLLSCQNSSKDKHNEYSIIDLTEMEYSESPQLLSDFVESIEYIKLSEDPLVTDARRINLTWVRYKS